MARRMQALVANDYPYIQQQRHAMIDVSQAHGNSAERKHLEALLDAR
jgi:hypothetical protein